MVRESTRNDVAAVHIVAEGVGTINVLEGVGDGGEDERTVVFAEHDLVVDEGADVDLGVVAVVGGGGVGLFDLAVGGEHWVEGAARGGWVPVGAPTIAIHLHPARAAGGSDGVGAGDGFDVLGGEIHVAIKQTSLGRARSEIEAITIGVEGGDVGVDAEGTEGTISPVRGVEGETVVRAVDVGRGEA